MVITLCVYIQYVKVKPLRDIIYIYVLTNQKLSNKNKDKTQMLLNNAFKRLYIDSIVVNNIIVLY